MAYGRKERFDKRAGVCHNEMHGKIRLTMLDQTDRSNAFFIKGKGRRKSMASAPEKNTRSTQRRRRKRRRRRMAVGVLLLAAVVLVIVLLVRLLGKVSVSSGDIPSPTGPAGTTTTSSPTSVTGDAAVGYRRHHPYDSHYHQADHIQRHRCGEQLRAA